MNEGISADPGVGFCRQFGGQRAEVGKAGGNDGRGDSRIKSVCIDSETMIDQGSRQFDACRWMHDRTVLSPHESPAESLLTGVFMALVFRMETGM